MNSVSIIIPTINESENLKLLIPKIEGIFEKNKLSGEIIVVDDKSTDGTQETVRQLAEKAGNIKLVERENPDGLGNALIRGVEIAGNNNIIFMDADLSHDPDEIPKFIEFLGEYDIVIGSRYILNSELKRGLIRNMISGTYNIVTKFLLGVSVRDFTSGYRAFHKEKFKKLGICAPGPEIHSELVIKSSNKGYRIGEIPITYNDREHGETKLNYLSIGPGYSKVMIKGFLSKLSKIF